MPGLLHQGAFRAAVNEGVCLEGRELCAIPKYAHVGGTTDIPGIYIHDYFNVILIVYLNEADLMGYANN